MSNEEKVLESKTRCQSFGCSRIATKAIKDTRGRNSYRCEDHIPKKPKGINKCG